MAILSKRGILSIPGRNGILQGVLFEVLSEMSLLTPFDTSESPISGTPPHSPRPLLWKMSPDSYLIRCQNAQKPPVRVGGEARIKEMTQKQPILRSKAAHFRSKLSFLADSGRSIGDSKALSAGNDGNDGNHQKRALSASEVEILESPV